MTRFIPICFALCLIPTLLKADEPASAEAVEKAAQAYVDSALAGDFPSVVDRTYPALVDFMGAGRS